MLYDRNTLIRAAHLLNDRILPTRAMPDRFFSRAAIPEPADVFPGPIDLKDEGVIIIRRDRSNPGSLNP